MPHYNVVFNITWSCHGCQIDFLLYVNCKQPQYNMVSLITQSLPMDPKDSSIIRTKVDLYLNLKTSYIDITKTCPCNNREIFIAIKMKIFDIFLIFAQNIDCGCMLEPPHRGSSNEYPQSMLWSKNRYTPAYPCFTI